MRLEKIESSFVEGNQNDEYEVYIKAREGEQYEIREGIQAFITLVVEKNQGSGHIEELYYKMIELEGAEELVIDSNSEMVLGCIVNAENVVGKEAKIYNCNISLVAKDEKETKNN